MKSASEVYFDVLDALCNRYMALSPFEVMHALMSDVFDLYVNCIIHDKKNKQGTKNKEAEWVTSQNATWR